MLRTRLLPVSRLFLSASPQIIGARKFSGNTDFPYYLLNTPATEVTTLPSGLRVASHTCHGETASVGVWIDAGSRYETAQNNGAAHFLEHMFFKGTGKRSQMELEVEIENMGAHLNAYTSREQTVYYAKVFNKDVDKGLDILSDILQRSKLDEAAIKRERDVIMREMEEVGKQQEEVILDYLHEVAYNGTGLGRTILGPEENVRGLSREDLLGYIQTHYTAPRMVVAGAGALEHQELVDMAEHFFSGLPTAADQQNSHYASTDLLILDDPAVFTGSHKLVPGGDGVKEENTHIALAFEGASWTSEWAFPLMILQTIMGSWDRTCGVGKAGDSQFLKRLAHKELCHSYTTFNTCYKDTGLIGLYCVVPHENVRELTLEICDGLMYLCQNVTEEEVTRAKTQLKTNMLMQLDMFSNICEDVGRQMLTYGRRMTPAEIFARIGDVDIHDIQHAANNCFNDRKHALAALVGPVDCVPSYEEIRERTRLR
uniref:Mitochondrial-processing peptidase subunit beta n=1 Tax=Fibrocapsa japonica TaxID=94617 RepID=A0A7S2V5V4_9STRA|mmetsp:Transcript_784/g.1138  ORF Transcript_784/g.1138 Transcript_784/m.1138 type:complete len:485 (+) Transcript_784:3-1457(+)